MRACTTAWAIAASGESRSRSYFGMRIGQQMLGLKEGATALDGLPFPSRPYYHGKPWFLAPSVFVYRAIDALGW